MALKKIKENYYTEKEKLSKLSFKEKLDYLKTYYLTKTVIILIIVICLVSLITSVFSKKDKVLFNGIFVNVRISKEGEDFLTNQFKKQCLEEKKGNVTISNFVDFDVDNVEVNDKEYYNKMTVATQVSTKEVDYIITDEKTLKYFYKQGWCMDLKELSEENSGKYSDDFIKVEDSICAIDLQKTSFAKKYNVAPEEAYLFFVSNTENKDKISKFMNCIIK